MAVYCGWRMMRRTLICSPSRVLLVLSDPTETYVGGKWLSMQRAAVSTYVEPMRLPLQTFGPCLCSRRPVTNLKWGGSHVTGGPAP